MAPAGSLVVPYEGHGIDTAVRSFDPEMRELFACGKGFWQSGEQAVVQAKRHARAPGTKKRRYSAPVWRNLL